MRICEITLNARVGNMLVLGFDDGSFRACVHGCGQPIYIRLAAGAAGVYAVGDPVPARRHDGSSDPDVVLRGFPALTAAQFQTVAAILASPVVRRGNWP
jgi:hypothetical protein